jgi:hypothetical protein
MVLMSDPSGIPAKPSTIAPPLSIPEAGTASGTVPMQWRCPRCGSTDLASAYLIDYSDKFRQLQLAPKALKLNRIARLLRPFRRMVKVGGQVCRKCGAVQLEVDPDDFEEAERRYGRR